MNWVILLSIITGIGGLLYGLGQWLNGYSGLLALRRAEAKKAGEASSQLVADAMKLVDGLTKRVEVLSSDNVAIGEQQLREVQVLRDRIKALEARVSELELENKELKIQLFDMGREPRKRRPAPRPKTTI